MLISGRGDQQSAARRIELSGKLGEDRRRAGCRGCGEAGAQVELIEAAAVDPADCGVDGWRGSRRVADRWGRPVENERRRPRDAALPTVLRSSARASGPGSPFM